ncbi:MAG: VTT domain-containing protein [Chloroflexi bacterium]|nr:VTT domain-containing protein [Chloroflexota bacterium]
MEKVRKYVKLEYIAGLLSISLTIGLAYVIVTRFDIVRQMGAFGYAGAFVVSIISGATIIIPIPGIAVVFSLGAVLNPLFVGIAAGLGEALGALTIYLTGMGGRTMIEKRFPKFYPRMVEWVRHRGDWAIFAYSAIFNPLYYPLTLACGALRFGLRRFFFLSWAGKTVKCVAIAYAGYYGLRLIFKFL